MHPIFILFQPIHLHTHHVTYTIHNTVYTQNKTCTHLQITTPAPFPIHNSSPTRTQNHCRYFSQQLPSITRVFSCETPTITQNSTTPQPPRISPLTPHLLQMITPKKTGRWQGLANHQVAENRGAVHWLQIILVM